MSAKRYRSLRVPRTKVWACFQVYGDRGIPLVYKSPVVAFGLTFDGVPVALVIGTESGRLEDAQHFENFLRFEYSNRAERYEALGC
jgi:hypothetical protein